MLRPPVSRTNLSKLYQFFKAHYKAYLVSPQVPSKLVTDLLQNNIPIIFIASAVFNIQFKKSP